jgi:hypothetical protein
MSPGSRRDAVAAGCSVVSKSKATDYPQSFDSTQAAVTDIARRDWLCGVCADSRLTVVQKFVLVRLALGRCEPGFDALAAEIGIGRSSILGAIDAALARGWLARHGGQTPRNFTFTFPFNAALRP